MLKDGIEKVKQNVDEGATERIKEIVDWLKSIG